MSEDSLMQFLLELVNLLGITLLYALDEEVVVNGLVLKVLVGDLQLRKNLVLSLNCAREPLDPL